MKSVLRAGSGFAILSLALSALADVAQLVEHNLAKVGVAGSNPVVRSIDPIEGWSEGSDNRA